MKLRRAVRRYLKPIRKELVRISGLADHRQRAAAFRLFWSRHCIGWDQFDPRLAVPRSLQAGYRSPRVWAPEPIVRPA